MSDAAQEVAQFVQELLTPGSETRRQVVEGNVRADLADIADGLRNDHRQGQRVHGQVVLDMRVSDGLLINIDDAQMQIRYALPPEDCTQLALKPGMQVSGIVDFTLISRFKGITLAGKPADIRGAIQSGSVLCENGA